MVERSSELIIRLTPSSIVDTASLYYHTIVNHRRTSQGYSCTLSCRFFPEYANDGRTSAGTFEWSGVEENVPEQGRTYQFRQLRRAAQGRNLRGCGFMSSLCVFAHSFAKKSSWTREVFGRASGPLSRERHPLTHHRQPRKRDARDATGRRSRLFRNGDAPASRIAEGLHCASATRASSTQPPRTARGSAPVCGCGR